MTVKHWSVVVELVGCECLSSVHPPMENLSLDPSPPMVEMSWLYSSVVRNPGSSSVMLVRNVYRIAMMVVTYHLRGAMLLVDKSRGAYYGSRGGGTKPTT